MSRGFVLHRTERWGFNLRRDFAPKKSAPDQERILEDLLALCDCGCADRRRSCRFFSRRLSFPTNGYSLARSHPRLLCAGHGDGGNGFACRRQIARQIGNSGRYTGRRSHGSLRAFGFSGWKEPGARQIDSGCCFLLAGLTGSCAASFVACKETARTGVIRRNEDGNSVSEPLKGRMLLPWFLKHEEAMWIEDSS
jgi:hypothetical protein